MKFLSNSHMLLPLLALALTAVFPLDFVFGSGTSAYQVEGAAEEDGRTPSIWDVFAHAGLISSLYVSLNSWRIWQDVYIYSFTAGHSGVAAGNVACDQYHKYKEDVKLMADMGLEAYRFSISWSRLLPSGRGPINVKGLQYYNSLIDELITHGIQPHVTLHHFDLPQALEDEYGGWLSQEIVRGFTAYADTCFKEFGDRVSHWTTINEVNVFALGGYDQGITPPARCSPPFGLNCTNGNSSIEPYIAVHNMLLAHASATNLYKQQYKFKQHGSVGISVYTYGVVPLTNSVEDKQATARVNDFYIGWILHPLVFGDYPETMKTNVGSRLPAFTEEESEQVKGAFDFFGVINYMTLYIKDDSSSLKPNVQDFTTDMAVEMTCQMTPHRSSLEDTTRVKYLSSYIEAVLHSIRNGSNVKGYFQWSFMDVFELFGGYEKSFGLFYVDFKDPYLKRSPKLSAHWYSSFLIGTLHHPSDHHMLHLDHLTTSMFIMLSCRL
ncbi:predicted protein [Arabidopsis lyrata subsp. lyrata]|uniref:Predicted protein n=1 Tax=Arabidopsis lyrata subsp. lyrata TaxID=81972 RepID=D7KBD0_ARALL|nr:predicted protein [Arabidopsis lyrata subsp. lyrata]